ncbi:cuticle collagen 7-like isoform X2 [Zalophus californianus]|uniref:Cuticle collagen 7-like isoform X2 n=1 Tax=Zalophus californianus TaxID=9704 RepID=A0A6J2DFG5_ZALCA|nr:cuticle collagen 7-like isoform X2 [Zalophus californianus]
MFSGEPGPARRAGSPGSASPQAEPEAAKTADIRALGAPQASEAPPSPRALGGPPTEVWPRRAGVIPRASPGGYRPTAAHRGPLARSALRPRSGGARPSQEGEPGRPRAHFPRPRRGPVLWQWCVLAGRPAHGARTSVSPRETRSERGPRRRRDPAPGSHPSVCLYESVCSSGASTTSPLVGAVTSLKKSNRNDFVGHGYHHLRLD